MISRYGSHALAAGACPGGGHDVAEAVDSVDTTSLLAGFDGPESVDTPSAVAGFDGGPTCRGARMAIEAARKYALAVSRRMPFAASIFLSDQPSRPSASTCCFFSSLKTLAIPARELAPIAFVNVPAPYISWPVLRCPSLAGFGCPPRIGRPPLDAQIVALIERMSSENPLWSRRRIASELSKLGHSVDKDTVAKYMPKPARRPRRPPSTTWRAFIRAHLAGTIAIDFLTVPTATFNVLYVFFVLSLDRRRLLHLNVTSHPHAAWTAQQIVEAIACSTGLVRLIRDRDRVYGSVFSARVDHLGIRQLETTPRSPWQNGYAERFVGTLRREVLDHVIVLGERHLLRLVQSHAADYNEDRPHMALDCDAPVPRAVEPASAGRIVALPRVAGLHHRYARAA